MTLSFRSLTLAMLALSLVQHLAGANEIFLGTLGEDYSEHQLAGDVYLISESILEIRGYTYDGLGPGAYFWADTNSSPTSNGMIIPDGSPSLNCALESSDTELPSASGITQRVEFPAGYTVRDFYGGSIGVWCEDVSVSFGHITLPASIEEAEIPAPGTPLECSSPQMVVPDIAKTPEGYNCEPLKDNYQVRWRINGNNIDVELVGDVPEDAYMGFGVSGSSTSTFMVGADTVVADYDVDGEPRARDFYLSSRGPCTGGQGVCPDTDVTDATNDVSGISGELEYGLTLVRYSRPVVPSDTTRTDQNGRVIDYTLSVEPGVETYVVWALGPVSPQNGNPTFHDYGWPQTDVTIEFGRTVADNCEPLVLIDDSPTTEPLEDPFYRPLVGDSDTVITAHIGPSGGPRGYRSITGGQGSWGIAWYMNEYLIPEVVLRRGTTYTFRVNGGNDATDLANYHPLYLTTSDVGGYELLTPQERLNETPLAGIVITETDADNGGVTAYDVLATAPICRYRTTDLTTEEVQMGSFAEYYDSLDTSCTEDQALMDAAYELQFTPDATTPDEIYYQCVTHYNLGFKITVIDEDEVYTSSPTPAVTEEPVIDADLSVLELQGQLEGATLHYKFNQGDERANGEDTISVVLEVPREGWAGFGISDNGGFMIGSEAIIGLPASGEVKKYDLSAQSRAGVQPMPADQQTLIDASIRQGDGTTTLTFTKILLEDGEIPIHINGENTFLSAWGSGDTLAQHAARGAYNLDGSVIDTREQSLWKAHGVLASIAWVILCPLAVASSLLRQFLGEGGLWFQIHRTLNSLVVACTMAAFAIAVAAINEETPDGADSKHFSSDFNDGHRTIGLVIFIVAFVQGLAGALRPHLPAQPEQEEQPEQQEQPEEEEEGTRADRKSDVPQEKSGVRVAWEYGHRLQGLGLLGLSWYQVNLGIKAYSTIFDVDQGSMMTAFGVLAGVFGAIVLAGLVFRLVL